MIKYAILASVGHNRVYFEASKKMSIYELKIALKHYQIDVETIVPEYIEDVFYITFECEKELTEEQNQIITKMSFISCLFQVVEMNDEIYLKPIKLNKSYRFLESDITTILKYSGKTNEIFTRLLINIAVNTYLKEDNEPIKLLDPIAGKGTTLFDGLTMGYEVAGVEIVEKVAHDSYLFLKKYLETKKIKHSIKFERVSGANKSFTAKTYTFNMGKDKEDVKNNSKICKIISGNSLYSNKFFKRNYFDVIVGDLPYGVQHGNVSTSSRSNLSRNPKDFVASAISAWEFIIKRGGVLVLSWNAFVFSYDEFKEIIENNGFEVLDNEMYRNFEHKVDKSIKRDIIVAIKK
ncbi:MAG: TRM11 family SAM-dependent methyltransferase [Lachnospirales bacterium]